MFSYIPTVVCNATLLFPVPPNFDSILQVYTSQGFRVIALAYKSLGSLPFPKVHRMQREEAERNLDFLGFVILENRLKSQTTKIIQDLNAAKMKIVMVTGDNILTALSVARECKMVKSDTQVIVVNSTAHQNQAKPHVYFTRSNSQKASDSPRQDTGENTNSAGSLESIESGSLANNQPGDESEFISNE